MRYGISTTNCILEAYIPLISNGDKICVQKSKMDGQGNLFYGIFDVSFWNGRIMDRKTN